MGIQKSVSVRTDDIAYQLKNMEKYEDILDKEMPLVGMVYEN